MNNGIAEIRRKKKGKRNMKIAVRFTIMIPKDVKELHVSCAHTPYRPIETLVIQVKRRKVE